MSVSDPGLSGPNFDRVSARVSAVTDAGMSRRKTPAVGGISSELIDGVAVVVDEEEEWYCWGTLVEGDMVAMKLALLAMYCLCVGVLALLSLGVVVAVVDRDEACD